MAAAAKLIAKDDRMICTAGIVRLCTAGAIKKGELFLIITTEPDDGITTEHWFVSKPTGSGLPNDVIKKKLQDNLGSLAGFDDLDHKHQIIVCDPFSLGYVKGGVDCWQGCEIGRELRMQNLI
ncbi:hypothetical protein GGF31_005282 [Allomyces arbusculus]|nr:hypothetical protein GGF31_005282 [Allomyces arbusculus]